MKDRIKMVALVAILWAVFIKSKFLLYMEELKKIYRVYVYGEKVSIPSSSHGSSNRVYSNTHRVDL